MDIAREVIQTPCLTTALYLRISDEDRERDDEKGKTEDQDKESSSITGQRLLLHAFIRNHRELSGSKIIEIVDDGYSGTDFSRPGVSALLEMARRGEIQCIVVKDFSRFGRNYLEVGNYLEQVFPRLGIRFLSVNDHFDSLNGIGAAGSLEAGFQNILHDFYSRDLSLKIRSARKTKAEQGKFVTAFAPYGYQKGGRCRDRLVIDRECADTVRRIFRLFLAGTGPTAIAGILNQEGVPSPLMVRRMRGEAFGGNKRGQKVRQSWTAGTVSRILSDKRYIGTAVFGKTRPKRAGSREEYKVPKEEWITVSMAHEGIVTREEFEQVRERRKTPCRHSQVCKPN